MICNLFGVLLGSPIISDNLDLSYLPHNDKRWKNFRDLGRNRSNHLNKAILPSDSSISFLASEALIRHNAVYYAQL